MLLKELLARLNDGEPMQSLAEELGCSKDTISRRLRDIGYKFNNSSKVFEFVGVGERPLELDFSELVKPKRPNPRATYVTAKPLVENRQDVDYIDRLLSPKEEPKNRKYRGYYFDEDLLEIVDRVSIGNKSELINEALRRVFKEKGLL